MTDRLFVYETLAPARPNEHVLAEVPGTWAPATVQQIPSETKSGNPMYEAYTEPRHAAHGAKRRR
jgi:hypothetical protein